MSAVCNPGSSPQTGVVNTATAPCRYGAVLVAASERGICDIQLGVDRETLVDNYRCTATNDVNWVVGDEQPEWLATVLKLVQNPKCALDYPLDVRGTTFQKLVWEALCNVSLGQTTTYSALAEAIGKPKAYRAVGAACGANRLALVIPCHRALRKGQGPLDYRWGADIKQQILMAEASWALDPP
ncbi:MAG: methylated-DNA--[protein]-cysteine S-methyltransferase [Caldilineaceae bacterium SB0662_bin_9]|uniref:Methylated-DNA--[protein]-cysteine S-methyltransferase n=1 Tax=Caldilineaceae bacterium SB0662_bin_9 TaxID=2605258 RepID=A0A6B1E020_9CHLR|nr:methylated-DNA--[protein]-cysteine S-methyltransferase [Caldilineaceae bacterium SB0662_bin_9]